MGLITFPGVSTDILLAQYTQFFGLPEIHATHRDVFATDVLNAVAAHR